MVLEGLFYLHESLQLVHSHLSLSNILFVDKTRTSPIKIIDFGQSRTVNKSQKYKGSMYGTYYYMAPEALNGFGCQPFILDESKFTNNKISRQAICKLIEKGFDATVELKELIAGLLEYDSTEGITVKQALEHPWIKNNGRNVNSINIINNHV